MIYDERDVDVITSLREQLATMTKERDDFVKLAHMAMDERDEYLKQLKDTESRILL